jgi:hypothetical protein
MLENFLNNKIVHLLAYFLGFILIWVWVLNIFVFDKLVLDDNYFISIKILSAFFGIYILNYIYRDSKNILDFISDSRLLFLVALFFLVYTIFYIITWEKKMAEDFSIKAYYFLIWWVFLEILKNIFLEKLNKNTES